jgi:CDP-paratose 2-epimerase
VVNLYFKAKDVRQAYGQVFNIGGGIENSLSLLELFDMLERKLNIKMIYTQLPWRESDQKVFVADIQKVSKVVGWIPEVSKDQGIQLMINWLKSYE